MAIHGNLVAASRKPDLEIEDGLSKMTKSDTGFTAEQYANAYPKSMQYHYWSLARCNCVFRALKKHGLHNKKVLEIGCGTGIVVANLREKQVDVDGCEIADIPKSMMLSDSISTGTNAFDLPLKVRESYEGLLLLDVLEHLDERRAFLNKMHAHFPNAGIVIVTVPARSELWSNFDEFYGHKLRYNRQFFKEEVMDTKWKVVDVRYFFHLIYLPMLLMAKINKKRDIKLGSLVGGKSLHKVLGLIFSLEAMALPRKVVGTSIIAHLQRRP